MDLSPRLRHRRGFVALLWLTLLAPVGARLHAQQHPAEITYGQSTELPYRLSGQFNVTFGGKGFFGTATYIRRYTGLTAGHLLFDPNGGFATNPYYLPAFYQTETTEIPVSSFAVLAGYQSAAEVDPNANAAFEHDTGYVLFLRPAPNNEWAAFGADTADLTGDSNFLVLGYAAENFPGDEQAFVNIHTAFYLLEAPALYENDSYYTESGMSGGPLYVTKNGVMQVAAVTVAGTDAPDPALSDVRAITATEYDLFTEAEYTHGLITSGVIKGPASLAPGASAKYKTGVVFADGAVQGNQLPRNYDELTLNAVGKHKKRVTITKVKPDKFRITFDASLSSGTSVTLALTRTTADASQTPLQTLTVVVQ